MSKHFVSNKDESPRIFKNNFLDLVSRVHWSTPLILYIPFTLFLLYQAIFVYALNALTIIGLFFGGMLFWSFAEYVLHRFVFHYQPPGKWGERLHFVAHGVHHDYPNDSKRLVMPPALSLIFCVVFWFIYTSTLGYAYTMAFFPGFVVGYLMYDMTHYALHHANIKHPIFQKLKEHHMIHHYSHPEKGFGVSSTLWDIIFRSGYPKKKANS
ncbi:MAG: sterol desaturase family protein [Bacteroidota bacterium]